MSLVMVYVLRPFFIYHPFVRQFFVLFMFIYVCTPFPFYVFSYFVSYVGLSFCIYFFL